MGGYLITGATLIDGRRQWSGCLRTADEGIAEVTAGPLTVPDAADLAARHGCELVDGRDRWLIPGGVDPHVHLGLPVGDGVVSQDVEAGTRDALAGGTTTVIDFVTPGRGESLASATEARLAELADACCDYALHASLTAWRDDAAVDLRAAVERFGLRSLKLYMAYLETIGLEPAALESAMAAAVALDLTVLLHCEDGVEVSHRQAALLAAGETGPSAHPRSRPPECEVSAVSGALELAARTGCRTYVVHVSTPEAVALITAARARGQTVFAETCPQYLLLDESRYAADFPAAARAVMSPPLRSSRRMAGRREALGRGEFDTVGTDHCAFTDAQKARGRDDFTRIPGGAAGIRHRLALLHTVGVDGGRLSPCQWVDLVSRRPAEIFGLAPRKGTLNVGADADLVLWDPRLTWTIDAAEPSVFASVPVVGGAVRVWARGRQTAVAGATTVEAGAGRRA
ncbi:MAG: amidohydrolase family protein [Candidatus Krumholzibacteriia bacterium]